MVSRFLFSRRPVIFRARKTPTEAPLVGSSPRPLPVAVPAQHKTRSAVHLRRRPHYHYYHYYQLRTTTTTTMFEARLVEGKTLKNIIESIKDLVTDANIECTEEEIAIQCMDSSHVSLVSVSLSAAAFDHYRCDRQLALGINSSNMSKVFKMMGNDDVVIMKAEDDGDTLTLMFESTKSDTIADFGKYHVYDAAVVLVGVDRYS